MPNVVAQDVGSLSGASIGTAAAPTIGASLGTLGGVRAFTESDLALKTKAGPLMETDHSPGIDFPYGCGRNSNDFVTCLVRAG